MHCGNPLCALCDPRELYRAGSAAIDPRYFKRLQEPWTAKVEMRIEREMMDMLTKSLGISMSTSPAQKTTGGTMTSNTQHVIEDIRRLHKDGADIKTISKEIDGILGQAKTEIREALSGVAKATTLGKPQGHPFVLAYWQDGKAKTLEGVNYARGTYIEEKDETREARVYLHNSGFSYGNTFYTMNRLEKYLNDRDIVHIISYFD
jgi:hypothetical protein